MEDIVLIEIDRSIKEIEDKIFYIKIRNPGLNYDYDDMLSFWLRETPQVKILNKLNDKLKELRLEKAKRISENKPIKDTLDNPIENQKLTFKIWNSFDVRKEILINYLISDWNIFSEKRSHEIRFNWISSRVKDKAENQKYLPNEHEENINLSDILEPLCKEGDVLSRKLKRQEERKI